MTAFSAFYDRILPELQGVTTAVVDDMLRQVAIEFCEETEVHCTEVTAIDVVAGTAEYTLTSPVSSTEACRIKAAWYNGVPLHIASETVLNGSTEYWRDLTSTQPWAYTQKSPDKIILFPEPEESLAGGLRVLIVLRPTLAATTITDWVATRYMRCLGYGVKGRLMAQPAKPWTNPDLATYNLAMYEASKGHAAADARRSFAPGALTVRMRPAV
jgi:hypothetical protein